MNTEVGRTVAFLFRTGLIAITGLVVAGKCSLAQATPERSFVLRQALMEQRPKAESVDPLNNNFRQQSLAMLKRRSGRNGIEELVTAYRLTMPTKYRSLFVVDMSVADKRRFLASSEARKILGLIDSGLSKPIVIPAWDGTMWSHPAIPVFSNLADGLAMRQEVAIADGRMHQAAKDLMLALKMARHSRKLGLRGWASARRIVRGLSKKLLARSPDLSAADCRMLVAELRAYSMEPRALANAVRAERTKSQHDWDELVEERPIEATTAAKVADADLYAYILANVHKPLTTWPKPPAPPESLNGEEMYLGLLGGVVPFAARAVEQAGAVRQTGVRFAIELYRKTHGGRLPTSLSDIKIGEMAIDPIDGKPFKYTVITKDRYALTGARAEAVFPFPQEGY